jgi:hypothetical protein
MTDATNPTVGGETLFTDEHIEFAHALVALAREHEANDLTVSFSLSGGRRFFKDRSNWQQVSFHWSEGRHGERSGFQLKAEASASIDERPRATITKATGADQ